MTKNTSKAVRNMILIGTVLAEGLLIGCANPTQSPAPRRMTLMEQKLSRTASSQEQAIHVLRDRLDDLKAGESARFGLEPAVDMPAEGPAYAPIPGAGPSDLSQTELQKMIEKQDALIRALRARVKELEKKKS